MTMTIDELLDSGVQQARDVLIGKPGAELVPTFVIQFKSRPPAIMATPWHNDTEKTAIVTTMRLALKYYRDVVTSYLFWSEAWAAHETTEHPSGLMPRDREDKIEVVIINAFDHDGGKMVTLEIERGPDGAVTELKRGPDVYDHLEGRLHNLLRDD